MINKSITFFSTRKDEIIRDLLLVVLTILTFFGHVPGFYYYRTMTGVDVLVAYLEPLISVFCFLLGYFSNAYWFIPRLLFRNKYISYVIALYGMSVLSLLIAAWTVRAMYIAFQLPPDKFNFDSFLMESISLFLIFVGTSMIVFLQHWWKSGKRIHELETIGVRIEFEKERSKIDLSALVNVLDEAASIVISFPKEASRMLMKLSKSLRRQLYEGRQKQILSDFTEKNKNTFEVQDRLLDFLVEKQYRLVRNILLMFVLFLLAYASYPMYRHYSFVTLNLFVCMFIAITYFNIYVLFPFLFLKNKLAYFAVIALASIGYEAIGLSKYMTWVDYASVFWWLKVIANAIVTGFMLISITALILFQYYVRNERHIAQLEEAAMLAELEQLQNQINPHFLFNMLNNILVLIREKPEEAVVILQKMSEMLKYQFNDTAKKKVLLNGDIRFLTDFLNLEKIRRDHFELSVSVENDTSNILVPPFLFIPFVENAVKHGNDVENLSYIRLFFEIKNDLLHFICINSKPAKPRKKNEFGGLGLINVKRRLELLYGANYSLDIQEDEKNYTVQLTIKL